MLLLMVKERSHLSFFQLVKREAMLKARCVAGRPAILMMNYLCKMVRLSDDEKRFVSWWETNRVKESKVLKQWLVGLPLGMLFGIPVFVNFFSGWYKKASMQVNVQIMKRDSDPVVILVAVLLIISFVAIFSKKMKWEKNEQRFRELQSRADSESSTENAAESTDR